MRYIRSFFLWIFFLIYAVNFLVFIILCTYLFPIKTYDPWIKFLLKLFFKISGIKVDIIGVENISVKNVYLFMANHVSLFDVVILGGYIPNTFRGIEADRQFKWPLYGFAVKRIGNISINRKSPTHAMKSIKKAIEKLNEGLSITVMPEGHRTLTGKMKPFKKMPFLLAKECERELVPIGLSGLYSLKKKGSWLITPRKIQIKFGKPIKVEEIKKLSIEELQSETRRRISDLIDYV